jgi:hypothetical protein
MGRWWSGRGRWRPGAERIEAADLNFKRDG